MDLKKQLVRSLIWSTALYGSESWALKKCDEKLLTAFEMWVWRRMLKISRTERKANTWMAEDWYTRKKASYSKLSIGNYLSTATGKEVVLAIIKGEIEGKCFPGRRRTAWIDDVRRWTGDDMNVAYGIRTVTATLTNFVTVIH